jgi:hypothetical protein
MPLGARVRNCRVPRDCVAEVRSDSACLGLRNRAGRPSHPRQRRRAGCRRHAHLRGLHSAGQGRPDAAELQQLPPTWPGRHRAGPRVGDHLPALRRRQLDHRCHPQRRRRRHGRTQLVSRVQRSSCVCLVRLVRIPRRSSALRHVSAGFRNTQWPGSRSPRGAAMRARCGLAYSGGPHGSVKGPRTRDTRRYRLSIGGTDVAFS